MFYDDPEMAFRGIAAALNPGSPIVFSCFRSPQENPWAAETIAALGGQLDAPAGYAPGPFALADQERIAALLRQAGFTDLTVDAADFTYRAGEGDDAAADAADFFRSIGPVSRVIAEAPVEKRAALLDRLRTFLAERERDNVVDLRAAAWIVTARSTGGTA